MFIRDIVSRRKAAIKLVASDVTFLTRPMPCALTPVTGCNRRILVESAVGLKPMAEAAAVDFRHGSILDRSRLCLRTGASAAVLRAYHRPHHRNHGVSRTDISRSVALPLLKVLLAENANRQSAPHRASSSPLPPEWIVTEMSALGTKLRCDQRIASSAVEAKAGEAAGRFRSAVPDQSRNFDVLCHPGSGCTGISLIETRRDELR